MLGGDGEYRTLELVQDVPCPTDSDVRKNIKDLVDFINTPSFSYRSKFVEQAALVQYHISRISPFGMTGTIGRLLMKVAK